MMSAYRLAWAVFVADAAYWIYEIGHSSEDAIPAWHSYVNVVLFYGGWLLLLVLLLVALTHRRST